jgi:hypothetical protein
MTKLFRRLQLCDAIRRGHSAASERSETRHFSSLRITFDAVVITTPSDVTRRMLVSLDSAFDELLAKSTPLNFMGRSIRRVTHNSFGYVTTVLVSMSFGSMTMDE